MKRIVCSCILMAALAVGQVPGAMAQSPASGSPEAQQPAIKVSLKSLVKEFKEQPVKAARKYDNQRLSFREDLYNVHIYSSGKVSLAFHWGYEFVYCELLDSEKQKAEKLKKGNSVSVEGLYKGETWIRLYDCTIK